MDISIQRDGLTLIGRLERASEDKGPVVILFHGMFFDLGYTEDNLYNDIVKRLLKKGLSVVRFDFNGHGKSSGTLENMDLFNELEDAMAILEYVRNLDFVTDIYVLGHSQGGVVGGMIAGIYPDIIKKLVLIAPAATLREDALNGIIMSTTYDTNNIPDKIAVENTPFTLGGKYFRIAKILPIYEVTKNYTGPMLAVHGINDNTVNVKASYKYKECMPLCQLEVFENIDHILNGEDKEKAIEKVVDFLS